MISSHLTQQMGHERIQDLRREADARRRVKLARGELDVSPSMTQPGQSLQPNPRPRQAVATLKPHRAS